MKNKSSRITFLTILLVILLVFGFATTASAMFIQQWEYNVTYHANNGLGEANQYDGSNNNYFTAFPGNTFTAPVSTYFDGWSTTIGGPVVYEAGDTFSMPARTYHMDLYAVWTPIPIQYRLNVTYHANNGLGEPNQYDGSNINSFVAFPANTFTAPSGMIFDGWSTTIGGVVLYNPGDIFSLPAQTYHMDLYAIWVPEQQQGRFPVTYYANNGSGDSLLDSYYMNGWIVSTLPEDTFTATAGINFLGWSLTPTGFVDYYAGDTFVMPFSAVDLYAIWTDKPTLNRGDHFAYMQGYPNGTFQPERNMSRAEAVVMFSRLLTEQIDSLTTYTSTYTDIGGIWLEAQNAIGYLQQEGVLSTPAPFFRPQDYITRAEFADLACGFENLTTGLPSSFSDVSTSHPYYDQINYAVARGWISGYPDGTFRPDNPIKRAEVTSLVNKVLERYCDQTYVDLHTSSIKYYYDMTNPASHWAYYQIMEASNGHLYTKVGTVETWTSLL